MYYITICNGKTQRLVRVPVGLRVPRARIPRFFFRIPRSRATIKNCFAFPRALAFLFRVPIRLQFTYL